MKLRKTVTAVPGEKIQSVGIVPGDRNESALLAAFDWAACRIRDEFQRRIACGDLRSSVKFHLLMSEERLEHTRPAGPHENKILMPPMNGMRRG